MIDLFDSGLFQEKARYWAGLRGGAQKLAVMDL
jgi:hypothetical protein